MFATDSELAAQAKRGDPTAYEELMRRHWETVHRVAYAITGYHDQADDAVQECFVRAYLALARFDENQAFTPWIKGIAVNCSREVVRSHKHAGHGAIDETLLDPGRDTVARVAASQLQAVVRQAIAQLPLKQRTAITLFALEEMDLAETAKVMDCAVGTVKAHLHRGRQKLRGLLSDCLEET